MPWYKSGTVAVTANSAVVTGTGTEFTANSKVGDAFLGPDGRWYEVTHASSATNLTIDPPYKGPTANGQAYAIVPVQGYVRDLALSVNQMIQGWGNQLSSLQPWSTSATAAAARVALGLGTAATGTLQSNTDDSTPNRVLTVPAFGVGGAGSAVANAQDVRVSGFYRAASGTPGAPSASTGATIISAQYNATWGSSIYMDNSQRRTFIGYTSSGNFNGWNELWHNGNLVIGTSGDAVGKLNTANSWSSWQTFTATQLSTGSSLRVGQGQPLSTNNDLLIGFGTAATSNNLYAYSVGDGSTISARFRGVGGTAGVSHSGAWDVYCTGFRPFDDGLTVLGAASRRWSAVYASTGTINTSDAREKTAVRTFTEAELEWAIALSEEIGAYQWLSAVEEKGNFARDHIGMTVQRAVELGESFGLDPYNYGFICFDQWDARTEVVVPAQFDSIVHPAVVERHDIPDPNNPELTVPTEVVVKEASVEEVLVIEEQVEHFEAGTRYSFRPDELQAFIIRGLAEQAKRDRARLEALECTLAILTTP